MYLYGFLITCSLLMTFCALNTTMILSPSSLDYTEMNCTWACPGTFWIIFFTLLGQLQWSITEVGNISHLFAFSESHTSSSMCRVLFFFWDHSPWLKIISLDHTATHSSLLTHMPFIPLCLDGFFFRAYQLD